MFLASRQKKPPSARIGLTGTFDLLIVVIAEVAAILQRVCAHMQAYA